MALPSRALPILTELSGTPRVGDRLILTKPLGVSIMAAHRERQAKRPSGRRRRPWSG